MRQSVSTPQDWPHEASRNNSIVFKPLTRKVHEYRAKAVEQWNSEMEPPLIHSDPASTRQRRSQVSFAETDRRGHSNRPRQHDGSPPRQHHENRKQPHYENDFLEVWSNMADRWMLVRKCRDDEDDNKFVYVEFALPDGNQAKKRMKRDSENLRSISKVRARDGVQSPFR